MVDKTENIECTCSHNSDDYCNCCEYSQEQPPIYERFDVEEFINQLNDWD